MAAPGTADASLRTTRFGRWVAAASLVLVLVLAACETDQDPGLDPGVVEGTAKTSNTLGTCPSGGPDATTPDAGCLGPDGSVQRP